MELISGDTQQLLWYCQSCDNGETGRIKRTGNDDEEITGDKKKLMQLRDHEKRGPNGNRLETI